MLIQILKFQKSFLSIHLSDYVVLISSHHSYNIDNNVIFNERKEIVLSNILLIPILHISLIFYFTKVKIILLICNSCCFFFSILVSDSLIELLSTVLIS